MRKIDRVLLGVLFLWMGSQLFGLALDTAGPQPRQPLAVRAALDVPKQPVAIDLGDATINDSPSKANSRYTGTAFALSADGYWGTATHVLSGCQRVDVQLQKAGGGFRKRPVNAWRTLKGTDVSVMDTERGNSGLPLAESAPKSGDEGFFFGYPKGRANAGYAVNIGKARMVRFRGREREPADVWTIYDFQPAKTIALGGNSGGPMMNAQAQVVGVVSAGNDRRGRVLTSMVPTLKPLKAFSREDFKPQQPLTRDNYVGFGKALRERGLVVRVDCAT